MADKLLTPAELQVLIDRVAQLEKTVAGTRTHSRNSGSRSSWGTSPGQARPAATGWLAAAAAAMIVLGWLGCCMTSYRTGALVTSLQAGASLLTTISIRLGMGFVGSVAVLAGGVGLLLRHRWAWWTGLCGLAFNQGLLFWALATAKGLKLLTFAIDSLVVIALAVWLIWLRREVFRPRRSGTGTIGR